MKPAIALLQGAWLYASRPRLQEPEGPRTGRVGSGPDLRLLILGDSAAAGVGVGTQDEALAGHLPRALAGNDTGHDTGHNTGGNTGHNTVHWRLAARCGATTATTRARLAALPAEPFDAVLLAVGINDAKNGVPLATFQSNYRALLDTLHARHGARLILCSALPPVHRFPTVPEPLRSVMGRRALRFDAALQGLCAETGAAYLGHEAPAAREMLAADGLHPGAPYYKLWADAAAARIRKELLP